MESGLLNAFLDDHYDGNYSSFEAENYWTHGNDTLGLQLSEALEGILPLSPVDNKPIFEDETDGRYSFQLDNTDLDNNTCIIGSWKQDSTQRQYVENEYRQNMSSPSIEIIAVDPNCDYSSPLSNFDEDSEIEYHDLREDDIRISHCSSRISKRTMSSSIADYESHTSDDSDYEDEVVAENGTLFNNLHTLREEQKIEMPFKLEEEGFKSIPLLLDSEQIPIEGRKSDGTSSLEAEIIDMKNFDLATFITRDDYEFSNNSSKIDKSRELLKGQLSNSIETYTADGDSEAEIIVDVETVPENENEIVFDKNVSGLENNEFNCQVEDDPIKDPSWSPTQKTATRGQKPRTRNTNKNSALGQNKTSTVNKLKSSMGNKLPIASPNSLHFNQNRKNVGLGRGKNISMCARPDSSSSSETEDEEDKNIKENCVDNSMIKKCKVQNTLSIKQPLEQNDKEKVQQKILQQKAPTVIRTPKKAIEVKIKGNQLIEVQPNESIKQEHLYSKQCLEKAELPKPNDKSTENVKTNDNAKDLVNSVDNKCLNNENKSESLVPPPKKKLNLEEYKKRRGKNIYVGNSSSNVQNAGVACQSKITAMKLEEPKKAEDVLIIPNQPNKSVSLLLKKEVCQVIIEKQFYDPIIEAKNKVLRMQELKKAAQTKLIDSTVSAKVGPVTKILPLEEIVKSANSSKTSTNKTSLNFNSDYEEIIIVSAGCNTDISLPPLKKIEELMKSNSVNGFLQSNVLLHNINNTLQKVKSSENIKISSNSLISSIQDVVLKKSTPNTLKANVQYGLNSPDIAVSTPGQLSPVKPEMSQTEICSIIDSDKRSAAPEHGEDKIIMHLRKDRVRPKMQTNTTQTENLPQFPSLELIMPVTSLGKREKSTINKERQSRRQYRSRRASYSSDESDCRSRSRTRIHSISSQSSQGSSSSKQYNERYSRKQKRHHSKSRSRKHSYRSRTRSRSKDERKGRKRLPSSSCSECSYSSSNSCSSRSNSRSRSSRSRSRSKSYISKNSRPDKRRYERNVSPAVEERRIVYVGRIEQETTKEDLKRKFMAYGPIRQITIHYKDTGMKYGFVTFEKAQDAFKAIDNGTRDPKINIYDISFGGRRAFCQASYSDLDGAATNSLQVCAYPPVVKRPHIEESFEDLLKAVKERIRGTKSGGSSRVKT